MGVASGQLAACGGCATVTPMQELPENQKDEMMISLPGIHCAGCMSKIEKALNARDDVLTARVNLTLKRAHIDARGGAKIEDMIAAIEGVGYEAYELDPALLDSAARDREGRALLLRLGIAGFAAMNIMLLSVSVWSGAAASTRDLLHWVSALIAVPVVFYAAQPFFRSALAALKVRQLNMDVPISLAILLALFMSIYETAISGEHAYFDAAISLTFFLLAGRYLDHQTRAMARSAAEELAALEVHKAIRIGEDGDETITLDKIAIGDHIRILPGARIPLDGIVVEGQSDIDASMLTGETLPELAKVGKGVAAGVLNLTGMLVVEVTAIGADTSLQRISKLVAIAETARTKYTSLADRAARIYAPLVHLLALVAFLFWSWYGGDWHRAMNIAIAVLIITCPCALGLAVPAVNTAASGRLFRRGVLLKSETALERLAEINAVMFDKTGTLTEGRPVLRHIDGDGDRCALLALASASAHPLAIACALALREEGMKPAKLENIKEYPGLGVEALYEGQRLRLGRAEWVGASPKKGAILASYYAMGDEITSLAFTDQARESAAVAIEELKRAGMPLRLISGDRKAVAKELASALGIDEVDAEVSPEEKARLIADMQEEGAKVLMVGDGLNDTAALSQSFVSISPASAIDVARTASDIVLLGGELDRISESFKIAKIAKRRILQNFALAAIYNSIAIPIALAGFATPLMAALAMSSSSIIVVLNANRIRWMK